MDIMMLAQVILCLLLWDLSAANRLNLYGADPRGGLWGAQVNLSRTSETNALLKLDRFALLEENVDIAAYDHVTKSVLLQTSYDATSSIHFGPICHQTSPPRFLTELNVVPLQDDQLGDCVNCETSGFALHQGKLYFLLYGEFFASDTISRLVQIRVFEACGQCGITGTKSQFDFSFQDMIECSSVVSEILREQFSFSDYDNMEVKGAKGMKVVQHGDRMTFFFLLGNITRFDQGHDKVSLSLWYANDQGRKKELHTVELRPEFSAWNIRALGSIDYSHHHLCWSTGDHILCGEYSNHHLHHQMVLLTPEEAATSGVCYEKSPENIRISGVAITRSNENNIVFFGCHPEDPVKGGTGMINFSAGQKQIRGVRTVDGPLLAGSLFIEKDLESSCPSSLDLDVCLGQTQEISEDDQQAGHSGHLHLDLSHFKEEPSNDSEETPEQLNIETKSDVDEDTNDDDANDDNDGDDDDYDKDIDDEDRVYNDNDMAMDVDYKYLYKTQELVMQGEGGVGTIHAKQIVSMIFAFALIIFF